MSKFTLIICSVIAAMLVSCANTQSVAQLERIQDTQGFLTKALYYVGSSGSYHYFDQYTLLRDNWDEWLPGHHNNDSYTSYRVARKSLAIPKDWEFAHSSYRGEDDARRVKVHLSSSPSPRVDKRVDPFRRDTL